jgi:hypothetical protein
MSNLFKELSELYMVKQENYLNEMAEEIEQSIADGRNAQVWKVINQLSGRKTRTSGLIAAEDSDARVKLWFKYFKGLLSPVVKPVKENLFLSKVVPDGLLFQTGDFSLDELNRATKELRNGKSVGIDKIANEILKCQEISDMLLGYFNICRIARSVPEEWHQSILVAIFKKGDPNVCGNYRGIALMCACAKLYNSLLRNRLSDQLDNVLRGNQNGFRKLRSTTQHVLAVRRLFEEIQRTQTGKIAAVFIDFSKAFDSVDWNYIENILRSAYCVPDELVDCIMSMYYGAKAAVRSNGQLSDFFELGVGVLQGDTLAPYLFDIVVDWIFRDALTDHENLGFKLSDEVVPQTSRATRSASQTAKPAEYLCDLDYADDIILLSAQIEKLQTLVLRVEKSALKVGLKFNVAKTVVLLIGNWNSEEIVIKTSSGVALERVDDFKYLGSWIVKSLSDFNYRKALAWTAIRGLNRIWRSPRLHLKSKFKTFQSLIWSIYSHNGTTWTMDETLRKKFDSGYNRLLRYALNIRWNERKTNASIFAELQIKPASTQLQKQRLTFVGHCWRSPESAPQPVSKLLFWRANGPYKRGRRSNFVDLLLKETGRTEEELKQAMSNRKEWALLVNTLSA